ncbi:MinD-like ATPase involved in chromosome partitioning or flagellar assembly [Arthrobacter sp. yr096]|uniref:chromosome partitioning protein ParA n=1 Tax=Arthrobacter sp. yr096 TaxID=1761750 RepID=UPI0008CC83D1|nr:chromosome partitioning protein ParA [Arthrobacter sp. yr096]SEJ77605.1 MinD-like ATPase involved in chromosome partitioning or flagellar assembly [Arthrobacter sp. yr096]
MGTTPTEVLAFPSIKAIVRDNGTAEVVVAGNSRVVPDGDTLQDLRNNALALVVGEAQTLQRPVRVQIEDPEGHGELIVHPDNKIESVSYEPRPARRRAQAPETTPETVAPAIIEAVPVAAPEPIAPTAQPAVEETAAAVDRQPWPPTPAEPEANTDLQATPEVTGANGQRITDAELPQAAVAAPEAPLTRRSLKETSFLVSAPVLEPATQGWRGTLTRLGFRMDPSLEELSEREDIRTVSQHWPGPRTIAVVNRKGGANKTPTVVMLSAILARYSGAATVAWDNNESQGTLGWRTEKGAHNRSVLDLIDSSTELLSPSTNAAEIAKFVHHQTADKFDVLRSDENEEGDHEVTAEEVDIAHQVLTRYYRLVVMDSGNTARAANWRRMIDHTNQLVVPVTAIEDRAEAARLTLQTLESRGGHDAELARNAVVIVSESTDAKRSMTGDALKRAKAEAQRIADGFEPFVRAVVRIPYDPALVNGPIRYEALQPATQRAWLAAAAAVAKGF